MTSVATGHIPGWGDETIAGSYPVSLELGWHGGSHLVAPSIGNNLALPVRAIADGRIAYVRRPTARTTDASPLNYGATAQGNCWTSDGVILIRHETDIGANAQGQATTVVFYSLYMHLESIAEGVRNNRPIYRKDEIGAAGFIYGQPHRIHFEIFCDHENLRLLTGRTEGDLAVDRDGRCDAVFGELYFRLPAGTSIYPSQPLDNDPVAHHRPPNQPVTQPAVPLVATSRTTEALIVGLRYASGDGVANQRGSAYLTTYREDGTPIGEPLCEQDAEYNLYTRATAISTSYPVGARPAPSAVYELLRFGRILDTAHETLTPANVPHWRRVRHSGGEGWANLNAPDVRKFSDADFPHWKGWRFVDDSADQDSRCDSPTIRSWFDKNKDGIVDAAEPRESLCDQTILRKLDHSICRFPTEWRSSTLDQRWGWLKSKSLECSNPLSEDDFTAFKAHAEALCFWERVPAQSPPLPDNPWRFHPRRFIQLFRRCGWLSQSEFAQCFPRRTLHLANTSFHPQSVGWQTANTRADRWKLAFNRTTRKYGIGAARNRLTHFFAHVIPETGYLSQVKEGAGENQPYSPYYGRGLIQLTRLDNYRKYGKFRKFSMEPPPPQYPNLGWDPDELIARSNTDYNVENCADSAGFYVAQRENMLSHLDAGVEQENAIIASKDVNGYVAIENLNSLDSRLQSVMYLKSILLDQPFPATPELLNFTWRRNSQKEVVIGSNGQPEMTGNPPHVKKKFYPTEHHLSINFEHQKP